MKMDRSWVSLVGAVALLCRAGHTQGTTRVSVDSNRAQGNGDSLYPSISPDGRYVAFESWATNLVSGDYNGAVDVFVRDRLAGTTELVSVATGGARGNGDSLYPSIAPDGRYLAFQSIANNLVIGDTNGFADIFVRDRRLGTTERVSIDSGGTEENGESYAPSISADGRCVAFLSSATNLVQGDTNGFVDIFVHDRQSGTTERVSVATGGAQGNGDSGVNGIRPSISADGRYVAFHSLATNLVPGDTNGFVDIFVRDRRSGTTERVSVGSGGTEGNGNSTYPSISADGLSVAFASGAPNLVAGDWNAASDIFVHDRIGGTTEMVSLGSAGAQGNSDSSYPSISADGRYVAFLSSATNLVQGDTNGFVDIFVHDRQSGMTQRVSVDSIGTQGDSGSYYPSISADGQSVAFESYASNLVLGDSNGTYDAFVHDLACSGSISTYCTAKTNSLGCTSSIGTLGLPSQSGADNFYVTASNVRNRKLGMMLWSLGSANNPFFGGTLCVAQPIHRTPGQNSGGSPTGNDCTGTYSYHFTQTYMLQQLLGANTTIYAQYWMRDPGFPPPNNIGLTNALRFTICP